MNLAYSHIFHSSTLWGGHLFTGDTIEINGMNITLKRNHIFLKEFYSISIPLTNIVNVKVIKHRSGADILVESQSQNFFFSKGYRYTAACRIKQLLIQ
ncbi:MAG: hypothetical protein ACM3ME_06195 [Chloroflexota bacterium]